MTGKHTIVFIIAGIFLFWGCRTVKTGNSPENQSLKSDGCQALKLVETLETTPSGDLFAIEELKISDNCLQVMVSYSGGCGETSFDLLTTGPQQTTYPPEMNIGVVFHDNDPCRSVVVDTLFVDLVPYESLARAGGLLIRIKSTDKKVMYALPLH